MSKNTRNIANCVMTAVLTIVMIVSVGNLVQSKSSDKKYHDFFSQKENFDVVFYGSSHVINGVFPMELWNDYGIVSYNFGGHATNIPTSYWVMKNSLDYTTPKLAVVDCYAVNSNSKRPNTSFSFMHLSFDAFPLTITKIRSVNDLVDGSGAAPADSGEPPTKIGLLWDFSVYHSRWNEVNKSDFKPAINVEKGAELRIGVVPGELVRINTVEERPDLDTLGVEYLKRIIEDCKKENIEVLLTYLPCFNGEAHQGYAEFIKDVAAEYDVNYIDFFDLDILNYKTDFCDSNSHLNPSGARKATAYIGEYIKEHYDIPDQRLNSAYSFWNDDYIRYADYKRSKLRSEKHLREYLMLLCDRSYNAVIEVYDSGLYSSEPVADLLKNLGAEDAVMADGHNLLFVRQGAVASSAQCQWDESIEITSDIGVFSRTGGDSASASLDGQELYSTDGENGSIRISVIDSASGRKIDSVDFTVELTGAEEDFGVSVVKARRK